MGSTAVSSNNIAAVVGYKLLKGYFNTSSPNLPQRIAILGEANTANQGGLSLLPVQLLSAKQAATTWGYGSPIHTVARILFPQSGAGVAVPVWVYPQAVAGGAVAKVITITPTGNATAAGVITVVINGRRSLDGASYDVAVASGDTPTVICDKIRAMVVAALGAPFLGTGTTTAILTAKWAGLTSNDNNVTIDLNGNSIGTTFAVVNTTAGAGTPSVVGTGNGLALFADAWNTLVINTYGLVAGTMTELETFNGVPDPTTPTGRYAPTLWKPFFALSGTCLDDPTTLTSAGARPTNVTVVACPTPLSLGLSFEAAANYAFVISNVFQNKPHGDVMNQILPDMPPAAAGSVPAMNTYTVCDTYVKLGCSTSEYINGATGAGQYRIKDTITTYNIAGEYPLFYSYIRDLNIAMNYEYGYHLLEQVNLVGKTLISNDSTATVDDVIKPRMWAADVAAYNLDCERRALLVHAEANNKSIDVTINGSNPNRMDTAQSYQISGLVRICSTDSKQGFNFTN